MCRAVTDCDGFGVVGFLFWRLVGGVFLMLLRLGFELFSDLALSDEF